MSLGTKKSQALFDKTGSGKKRLSDTKQSQISSSYAGAALSTEPSSPDAVEALVYIVQEMQEDIEELRRYVTNEATGSAVKVENITGANNLPTSAGATGTLYKDKSGFIKIA